MIVGCVPPSRDPTIDVVLDTCFLGAVMSLSVPYINRSNIHSQACTCGFIFINVGCMWKKSPIAVNLVADHSQL